MFNPLSLLTGWQSYALTAAATALLVIPTTVWATSQPYKITIANMEMATAKEKAANTNAVLDKYISQTTAMQASANALLQSLPQFQAKFEGYSKDLKNESVKNPLPASCRPSVERLRILTVAVAAANAAAAGNALVERLKNELG
jgi:hypothetical protein